MRLPTKRTPYARVLKLGFPLFGLLALMYYVVRINPNAATVKTFLIAFKDNSAEHAEKGSSTPTTTPTATPSTTPNTTPTSTPSATAERPSAKWILQSKPPFEDSDIIKLYPAGSENQPLIKSTNTVVTGYFRIPSKHGSGDYNSWMRNMLSLQDAMVIFTESAFVDQIKDLRRHAVNRTVIVPIALDDLPIAKVFSENFWKDQLERDPEKGIHRSHQVFWIWLSKSWAVTQAIRMNVFDSDLFVWSDIGCFRDRKYNSKTMVLRRDMVPPKEILFMAKSKPNPPEEELFNDKYHHKANFYHSGSIFVGFNDTFVTFHELFLETIDRFVEKNMIIVEDQAILQSVCLSHPEICAYVPFDQVKDNSYFGIRHVLHFGGEYNYWRVPPKN